MPIRVLIVDDDKNVARLYARILSFAGYATTEAHSYREAVRAIEASVQGNSPYALAIVDYVMPYIKGDRLARYIRKRHPEMAIIMLSAQPDERLLHDGFGIADRFVKKPLKHDETLAVVAEVLAAKQTENDRLQRHFVQQVLSPSPTPPTLAAENASADSEPILVGDLIVDQAHNHYVLSMTPLELTLDEAAVLILLAKHAPHPVARSRLEEVVQDDRQKETSDSRLNRIIHSLRTKLRSSAADPPQDPPRDQTPKQDHEGELLKTLRGVGYYLDSESGE